MPGSTAPSPAQLVSGVWNLAHVLRNDGVDLLLPAVLVMWRGGWRRASVQMGNRSRLDQRPAPILP